MILTRCITSINPATVDTLNQALPPRGEGRALLRSGVGMAQQLGQPEGWLQSAAWVMGSSDQGFNAAIAMIRDRPTDGQRIAQRPVELMEACIGLNPKGIEQLRKEAPG